MKTSHSFSGLTSPMTLALSAVALLGTPLPIQANRQPQENHATTDSSTPTPTSSATPTTASASTTPKPPTAPTPKPAPDFTGARRPYHSNWRLHYGLSTEFPPSKDAQIDYDSGRMARICQFLNARYGKGSALIVDPSTIALSAQDPITLVKMKHEMVEWDRTAPQVRLDVYALQLSGNDKTIARNRVKVDTEFARAQQAVQAAMSGLTLLAAGAKRDDALDPKAKAIWEELERAHFNTNSTRQMTLPEILFFISILSNRETAFRNFQAQYLQTYLEIYPERAQQIQARFDKAQESHQIAIQLLKRHSLAVNGLGKEASGWLPFSRLGRQFSDKGRDFTLASLEDYLRTWNLYRRDEAQTKGKDGVGNYSLGGAPETLRLQVQKGDALFEGAVTDLAADLQELIYHPLLEDLKVQSVGGIDLVAQNSLIVTSTLDNTLGSNGNANFRVDLAQKLTPQQFVDIVGEIPKVATALGVGAVSPLTAGTVLGALQTNQNFTNALLYESDPRYANLKPTVRVDARPTVQGDGSRSHLQLRVTASIGVQSRTADGKVEMGPIDHVETQEGNLDSTISGLDLLQVTATSLTVTHPRPKTGIPILSRVPVLGDAFSWKRGAVSKGFETRVITNAIIIPRALDMVEFYTSGSNPLAASVPQKLTGLSGESRLTPEEKRQITIESLK